MWILCRRERKYCLVILIFAIAGDWNLKSSEGCVCATRHNTSNAETAFFTYERELMCVLIRFGGAVPCRTHTFLWLFLISVLSETCNPANYDIVNETVCPSSWWGPSDTDVTRGCLRALTRVRQYSRSCTYNCMFVILSTNSLPARPSADLLVVVSWT